MHTLSSQTKLVAESAVYIVLDSSVDEEFISPNEPYFAEKM